MALTAAALVAAPATAQSPFPSRATAFADRPAIAVGVAWYPEQWPETRWDTDLKMMRDTGFNTVRIGEFAWSRMEPREGEFDFGWMDRAIAAARRHGLMVVIGTPTAAPPAWMTQKYPDTLRVDENGTRAGHGGRRHFSFASPRYRAFARRVATEMARRYGHDTSVVGWQIDNEVGPPSWDPQSITAWHAFLKARYGTVEELNRRWTTQYWSQSYNDFAQVPLRATGQHNPGLLLDFRHFTTATWVDYVQSQARAIRPLIDARAFVTTNTMYWNAGFDHFAMHRDLDIASWDNYIQGGRPDWVANGANHDLVRGYKQRNFWLMETQPGRVDWAPVNRALDPGQVREMAWQAVGHGADAVLYWQWRPAANGQETYHGAVLGQDGKPNPIQPEIAQVSAELVKAAPLLADTAPTADVAMVFSYDSRWAIDMQRHHRDFDPIKAFTDFYRPLRVQSQGVGIVSSSADLTPYRLVVAPNMMVMTRAEATALEAYVRGGGHVVLGPRSGMRDDANALWPMPQPGPLTDLLGARVAQYYALDAPVGITGSVSGKVSIWAEELEPLAPDVRVLARFDDKGGWLDNKPAIVTRHVGKGRITYVGAWLEPGAMAALATGLLADAKVAPIVADTHPDVEIAERRGAGKRVLIAINHGTSAHPLRLPAGARAAGGDWDDGQVPAHGVALFTLPEAAK
ncbi:cellulase family glycosylhydrolase [Polymorphobacter fuscus]|uniref:Beta-galactosidase n=2 Tax=Sandarakinorhabdus fusca TaxID=1439888 RepID=A0A7C9KIP5_9SPHN|nr:beta-galactosidase [Polymorphobacter fuscus]KAB7646592.1 beta-galactosidase [Polymorphobacter fuscus]MQT17501.1 cellulase family glycosylhydrolase [Polymorphobacter fuscus]